MDHHYSELVDAQRTSVNEQFSKTSGEIDAIVKSMSETNQHLIERLEQADAGRMDLIDKVGRELNTVKRDLNTFRKDAIAALQAAREPFTERILPDLKQACNDICANLETVNSHLRITKGHELLTLVTKHLDDLTTMSAETIQQTIDQMPPELALDLNHVVTDGDLQTLEQNWFFSEAERYHGYYRLKSTGFSLSEPHMFYAMVVDLQQPGSVIPHDRFFISYMFDETTRQYSPATRLTANNGKELETICQQTFQPGGFADPLVRLTTKGQERAHLQATGGQHPATMFEEHVRREAFLKARDDNLSVRQSTSKKGEEEVQEIEQGGSWEISPGQIETGGNIKLKKKVATTRAPETATQKQGVAKSLASGRTRSRSPLSPGRGEPFQTEKPEHPRSAGQRGRSRGGSRGRVKSGSKSRTPSSLMDESEETGGKPRSRSHSWASLASTAGKQVSENSGNEEEEDEDVFLADDDDDDEEYEVGGSEEVSSNEDTSEGSDQEDSDKETGKKNNNILNYLGIFSQRQ